MTRPALYAGRVLASRLRPVDLARLAGVSTQQIRNYEEAGILPAAARTPTGYRTFDARHRDALRAYRALLKGYGAEAARMIMRAVHAGAVADALTMLNAAHAALHAERLALQATFTALEAVAGHGVLPAPAAVAGHAALPAPEAVAGHAALPAPKSGLRVGELAAVLGVRSSALRVWEATGLLAPSREPGTRYRRYTPADVRDARMIAMLRRSRYPLSQIRPVLDGLRQTGSSDALRAAIGQRQAALTERTLAMLEGSARLHHYLSELGARG